MVGTLETNDVLDSYTARRTVKNQTERRHLRAGMAYSGHDPDFLQARPVTNDPRADVGGLAATSIWTAVRAIANRAGAVMLPSPSKPRTAPHEREYPWRKDRV